MANCKEKLKAHLYLTATDDIYSNPKYTQTDKDEIEAFKVELRAFEIGDKFPDVPQCFKLSEYWYSEYVRLGL